MKTKNVKTPFWAYRHTPNFMIVRVVDKSVKEGITCDMVAYSSGHYSGKIFLSKKEVKIGYSTFHKNFFCISKMNTEIKRRLLRSIL